jgi:hypothetical protein
VTTAPYLHRLDHSLTGDDVHPYLGAVLLSSKRLRPDQLDAALLEQARSGRRLGEVLVERGWLFPQDIAQALAAQFGIEYVDINHVSVDLAAAGRLSAEVGQRCCAIGVRTLQDGSLLVAVADPTSAAIKEVEDAVQGAVVFAVTERTDIENAWRRILSGFKP